MTTTQAHALDGTDQGRGPTPTVNRGDYAHVPYRARFNCHHERRGPGVVVTSSGVRQVYPHCLDCGRKLGGQIKGVADGLPIIRDNRTDAAGVALVPPCERCGKDEGVEVHHWAPQALFPEDFDQWPTAHLCTGCHRLWHRIVTPRTP